MDKVENTKNINLENDEMSRTELRLLIEYLTNQGWTNNQIVDLLKYISR